MNSNRKRKRLLFAFCFGFPFFVVVATLLLALLPIWDGPPVDDSDMRIVHREIPDEQNAFDLFRQAAAAMEAPEVRRTRDWVGWNAWRNNPADHEDDIRAWVASNEKPLRLLREGVALGDYQTPDAKRMSDEVPWVTSSLESGNLLRYAVLVSDDSARREEILLLLLRYADMNYHAGSTLVETLAGIALYTQAFDSVFETLHDPETDDEHVRQLLAALRNIRVDAERMVRALQSEYRGLVLIIEEVLRGEESKEDFMDIEDFPPFPRPYTRPGTWGYQEENTKRLYLEFIRILIAYLRGEEPVDRVGTLPRELEAFYRGDPPFYRKTHNLIGKMLLTVLTPSVDATVHRYKETVADHHAAMLLCALHLHAREQGELPDTLDALVPAYLDEVPADPFDNQPFRYLPDQARIYSIGRNRADNGGSILRRPGRQNHSHNDSEDRVYKIFEAVKFGD